MQSFISRWESPKLSSFKRGHEVHESLCLAHRNHRDACLDLRRTFTNFKQCLDNYYYLYGVGTALPHMEHNRQKPIREAEESSERLTT